MGLERHVRNLPAGGLCGSGVLPRFVRRRFVRLCGLRHEAAAVESAAVNLEEVVVLGFVLHRLRQIGWGWTGAIWTSALIRGSYHLYQGVGGFVGNVVMGLLFGWLFRRWGRVMPMIIAHAVMDSVAFIGYAVLEGRVSWLP